MSNQDKKRENDVYRCDEFQSFEEYQHFPSEHFSSVENVTIEMENYKSEEIKKVSFVEEPKSLDKNKNKLGNLNNKILSSTTTAASTVCVSAVAIVGAITLGIAPIGNNKPISFGVFEYQNTFIDLNKDNDSYKIDRLYLSYTADLNDEYFAFAKIQNIDGVTIQSNLTKNGFTFSDLKIDNSLSSLKVEIEISNGREVIHQEEKIIPISTTSHYHQSKNYTHGITFNDNNTTNFYTNNNFILLKEKYSSYNLLHLVEVFDKEEQLIDSYNAEEINNGKYIQIEDIPYDLYSVENKLYYKENEVFYLLSKEEINDISSSTLSNKYLNFKVIHQNLVGDINFINFETFTYKVTDNNSYIEEFAYDREFFSGIINDYYIQNLQTQTNFNIDATITCNPYTSLLWNDFLNNNPEIKGNTINTYSFNQSIQAMEKQTSLTLSRFEVAQENPYTYWNTALYFEGYVPYNHKVQVDAIDQNGNIVETSSTTWNYLDEAIAFSSLDNSQTYTFEYYVINTNTNDVIEETRNSYATSITNNYDGEGVSFSVPYYRDYYLTYNNDYTYNFYCDLDIQNPNSLDLYVKFQVVDLINHTNEFIKARGGYAEIIGLRDYCSLKVGTYIQDPNDDKKHYLINSETIHSGTTGDEIYSIYLNGNNTIEALGYEEITEKPGFYNLYIPQYFVEDDIELNITLDESNTFNININRNELSEVESGFLCELDLSQYDFTTAYIEIGRLGNLNGFEVNFSEEIIGSDIAHVYSNTTIYK